MDDGGRRTRVVVAVLFDPERSTRDFRPLLPKVEVAAL
jgi:hypothetical protein